MPGVEGDNTGLSSQKTAMKVLHVYRTYFPDSQGGLEEVIRQICLNTRVQGVESRIFSLSTDPHDVITSCACVYLQADVTGLSSLGNNKSSSSAAKHGCWWRHDTAQSRRAQRVTNVFERVA